MTVQTAVASTDFAIGVVIVVRGGAASAPAAQAGSQRLNEALGRYSVAGIRRPIRPTAGWRPIGRS